METTKIAPFWPHRCPSFHSLRLAVRETLTQYSHSVEAPLRGVVVGLSGGADSLALAAACAAESISPAGVLYDGYVHTVTVDHGLQSGSAEVAQQAAQMAESLGASAEVVKVQVPTVAGGAGPEALARTVRHEQLRAIAAKRGVPLLLAHTLDDQAETMLLRLARGGGPYALSAMGAHTVWSDGVTLLRPLLGIRRRDTVAACAELGFSPWQDPHNDDRTFTRVKIRHDILPILEKTLGPGVAENLAKTAELARKDNEALDAIAHSALAEAVVSPTAVGSAQWKSGIDSADFVARTAVPVAAVAKQHDAIQTRMLREWIHVGGGDASSKQINDVLKLVNHYHGQGPVFIPSGAHSPGARLVVARKGGTLALLELSANEPSYQESAEGSEKDE